MAKRDSEYEWRMQGMIYACNIAKEQGVEALERDIKKRGMLKAPLKFSQKQMDEFVEYCSHNLYANMFATMAYSLHELYGFGGERIKKLQEHIGKLVNNVMDMDYMGEHYIRLEDYAIELNEKYNLGIDVARIASCQDLVDEKEESGFHLAKIEKVCEEMREAGFQDAAAWLEKKVS